MRTSLRYGAAAIGITVLLAACGDDADNAAPAEDVTTSAAVEQSETATAAPTSNIVETASAAGTFETLVAAVEAAGLGETLSGDGPFTVFAPTDEAFAALPEGLVAALLEEPETLAEILTYHVVAGNVLAADVVGLSEAASVNGDTIAITVDGSSVMVDGANVVTTDIATTNGTIHVIDSVILPEGIVLPEVGQMMSDDMSDDMAVGTIVDVAVEAGSFTTLVAAVDAAGLTPVLSGEGPFTVFAPTDEAFAALPAGTVEALLADPEALADILTYHVVAGEVFAADVVNLTSATTVQGQDVTIEVVDGNVFVDGAMVVTTDIATDNGVIHVIDAVILPETGPGTIVDVAAEAGSFSTLLAAAEAAGLVDALNGEGPLTVFAPTDDAFAALPEGTVEALLADTEALTAILTAHVVPGELLAADVLAVESLTMLSGDVLEVALHDGAPTIGGSGIIATDMLAGNGVIHVIDTVIVP